jgi:hypothetical protein
MDASLDAATDAVAEATVDGGVEAGEAAAPDAGPLLDCPSPGDSRIAPVAPYADVPLNGGAFATRAVTSWQWTIVGNDPCDVLYASPGFTPYPTRSFSLVRASTQNAAAFFTLSGSYTVTLTATDADGVPSSCTWNQQVAARGLRVELCWDHEGTAAQGGADLDLHVHRSGTTTSWFNIADDCFIQDCTPDAYNVVSPIVSDWGYAQSALASCSGASTVWGATALHGCPNPRLDSNNTDSVGVAENTNIDDAANGSTFRVMVHYYGQGGGASLSPVTEHPIVNIYCDGSLAASYGQAPDQLASFNRGMGDATGLMWRVADVTVQADASGNTTGCTVAALHPPGSSTGYYVTNNDTTF